MNRIFLSATSFALIGLSAHAAPSFAPFAHDIECVASSDRSTRLSVVYDKTKRLDLGLAGEIRLELNTGISELSHFSGNLGLEKPYRRIVRRTGIAGQVGNWIEQDKQDPFVLQVRTGFVNYEVLEPAGKGVEKYAPSFISTLKLSRVKEKGFHDKAGGGSDTQEFLDLYLLDDYGTHHMRFVPSDCKLLN
jgi:hypothetical protein